MRKNAWMICCCTAVLSAFGIFFRWLQDQVCFEAETGLAVHGSIWPYVVALMIAIAAAVLGVVCFRVKNQPHTSFPDSLPAAFVAVPRVRTIGGVVLGYIWSLIFDGILKNYSTYLTANGTYGFWGLVILVAWQQIGYMMIIYVAGLQSVPGDLIEAAKIDGANDREILFKIKIPMVMPSVTICTFLTLTNSFKLFDQNVALTAGEPANASEMLALNIYNTFYGRSGAQWKGIGQAKAVVFFLIVVVISLIQLHFTRSKEVQQ